MAICVVCITVGILVCVGVEMVPQPLDPSTRVVRRLGRLVVGWLRWSWFRPWVSFGGAVLGIVDSAPELEHARGAGALGSGPSFFTFWASFKLRKRYIRGNGGPYGRWFLVLNVTNSHTPPRLCGNVYNRSDLAGVAWRRRRAMRRIKPVVAVTALMVAIFGEQWLRSKVRQPVWRTL